MLVYDTRERGSGQLGGRPQLIEKGLDKADRLPQTCHFSWFSEPKWVKRQQMTENSLWFKRPMINLLICLQMGCNLMGTFPFSKALSPVMCLMVVYARGSSFVMIYKCLNDKYCTYTSIFNHPNLAWSFELKQCIPSVCCPLSTQVLFVNFRVLSCRLYSHKSMLM